MSLLPDDSLNYGDYCQLSPYGGSYVVLSVILGLVVASTDRDGGPLSIKNLDSQFCTIEVMTYNDRLFQF
jgi:hypothetical protein